jgi:hypothetical protein
LRQRGSTQRDAQERKLGEKLNQGTHAESLRVPPASVKRRLFPRFRPSTGQNEPTCSGPRLSSW